MNEWMLIYIFVLLCHLGAAAGFWTGRPKTGLTFGFLGVVICGLSLVYITFSQKRLPVYGPTEATLQMLFISGAAAVWYGRKTGDPSRVRFASMAWLAGALLLFIFALAPKELNRDFYLYDSMQVLLFFNLRITAMGFLLYSLASCCEASFIGDNAHEELRRGRNFLLLGACFYLCSEFSGCLWCLNGWGDSWSWSKGFFRSSILFLLMMTGAHYPLRVSASFKKRVMTCAMPAFCVLALFVSTQF